MAAGGNAYAHAENSFSHLSAKHTVVRLTKSSQRIECFLADLLKTVTRPTQRVSCPFPLIELWIKPCVSVFVQRCVLFERHSERAGCYRKQHNRTVAAHAGLVTNSGYILCDIILHSMNNRDQSQMHLQGQLLTLDIVANPASANWSLGFDFSLLSEFHLSVVRRWPFYSAELFRQPPYFGAEFPHLAVGV